MSGAGGKQCDGNCQMHWLEEMGKNGNSHEVAISLSIYHGAVTAVKRNVDI